MRKAKTDPFKQARRRQGLLELQNGDEAIPLLLRYDDVRAAARDWGTFSSDAPFRVPVPSQRHMHGTRQLPIETDPPEHTEYRAIVDPFFRKPSQLAYQAAVGQLVRQALDEALSRESLEAVHDFALPLQSRALALLLGVPMSDAEHFISWGTNVLTTPKTVDLGYQGYIEKQLKRTATKPGKDLFSALNTASFRGRKLTWKEKVGFADLVFAGGRDTIITLIVNTLVYLAASPEALTHLRGDSKLVVSATEELLRFFSPLTFIGRVCPQGTEVHGRKVQPDARVGLCWHSANMDETAFEAPGEIRLDRRPNPHVAFGRGPHLCPGAHQARLIMRVLLAQLAERVQAIGIGRAEASYEDWKAYLRQNGYKKLEASFTAR